MADINGDGYVDVVAGSYSRGPRDGDVDTHDALGRIGWFEHPGDATGARYLSPQAPYVRQVRRPRSGCRW